MNVLYSASPSIPGVPLSYRSVIVVLHHSSPLQFLCFQYFVHSFCSLRIGIQNPRLLSGIQWIWSFSNFLLYFFNLISPIFYIFLPFPHNILFFYFPFTYWCSAWLSSLVRFLKIPSRSIFLLISIDPILSRETLGSSSDIMNSTVFSDVW
jgi:hypothetical protein